MGLEAATIAAIAAVTGATAAVGGTAYSVYSGEKQREEIENEKGRAAARAQDQKNAADKAKADALAKEQSIRTRDAQAARARIAASGKQGRAGTILTSPAGTPAAGNAAPGTGGKTILGA